MPSPDVACRHPPGPGAILHPPVVLERAAALFRAVGDPSRLRLLERLAHAEACVSELARQLDGSLSAVSQRLKILRTEGLIGRRRQGKHVYYHIADQHVFDLVASGLEHAQELLQPSTPRG